MKALILAVALWENGEYSEKTFEAKGTEIIPVSPFAFVYRETGK